MNSTLHLSHWGRNLGKYLMKPIQKKKPVADTNRWNIVRGDLVQVTQGPQTGQQGKVLAVLREKNRLLIEGVNMVSGVNTESSRDCAMSCLIPSVYSSDGESCGPRRTATPAKSRSSHAPCITPTRR